MRVERSRPPSWMRHGAVGVMVVESLLALLSLPVLPIVVAIALTFSHPNRSFASPKVALAPAMPFAPPRPDASAV